MYRIAHVQDSPPAVRGAALAICGAMNQKQWLRDDVDLLRPDLTTLLHGRNACAAAKRAAGDLERTGADASALPHGEPLLCLGPAEQMEEHAKRNWQPPRESKIPADFMPFDTIE